MAFTGTINTIEKIPDSSGVGINWQVGVIFADSATGFTSPKTYIFPMSTTQAAALAIITADGDSLKTALGSASTLANKIGTVITI